MNPPSYCISPPFIAISPFPLSLAGLFPVGIRGYLSHHLIVLPLFHQEIGILRVFLLFRPINQHLMWQRLDVEPH